MVFTGPVEIIEENESTPLSPEQVHNAHLKCLELDRALGLSPEKDPTDDESNEEEVEEIISDWDDETIAKQKCFGEYELGNC